MTIGIHSMSVEELSAWLHDKPANATLVDVREYAELEEQGVIKGYDVNIPWFLTNTNPSLFEKKFNEIDKEAQVKIKGRKLKREGSAELTRKFQLVISCRSGRRSGFAAEYVVSKLGFKNVYNVQGGILDWISHGYPVDKVNDAA